MGTHFLLFRKQPIGVYCMIRLFALNKNERAAF